MPVPSTGRPIATKRRTNAWRRRNGINRAVGHTSGNGVAALANSGPKENGVRPLMTIHTANFTGESGAGFLPYPLLCGPKGDEKSFAGNPAGSTRKFPTDEFAAISSSPVIMSRRATVEIQSGSRSNKSRADDACLPLIDEGNRSPDDPRATATTGWERTGAIISRGPE